MKTVDLIAEYRQRADDFADPPLFRTPDILRWLREAEDEAAMRRRMLPLSSIEETEVTTTKGVQAYDLTCRVWLVTHAWLNCAGSSWVHATGLKIRSREALDAWRPDWQIRDCDRAFALIHEDARVTIAGNVEHDGTLRIEGYRLPCPMETRPDDGPEIHPIHHRHLVDWALYRGYSIPDREVHNPGAAQAALDAFERYFGPPVDADLKRDMEADQVHHNRAW